MTTPANKRKRTNSMELKAARKLEPTPLLELEFSAAAAGLEEKLRSGTTGAEWTPMEWMPLLFLAVGIVTAVEPSTQLWVAKDLVCFIDFRHFLLRLFFRYTLRDGFVRVEFFGQGAVLAFDGSVVGVIGNIQYFVVVFDLGSFQLHLRLLEELVNSRR